MKRYKIAIPKRTLQEDLAREYAGPGFTKCPMMKEGQVFYADYAKPDGFCDEAWKAVYQYVFALSHGAGTFLLRGLRGYLLVQRQPAFGDHQDRADRRRVVHRLSAGGIVPVGNAKF